MADSDAQLETERMNTLKEMRQNFSRGDSDATLAAFESLGEVRNVRTGIRIEAICLASRAWAAKGDRAAARSLLRPVAQRELPSARFYGYLAASLLDLHDYEGAAQACAKAAALVLARREAEQS